MTTGRACSGTGSAHRTECPCPEPHRADGPSRPAEERDHPETRPNSSSLSPTFFRSVSDEIPAKRTLLVLDRLLSSVDPVDGHFSHLTGLSHPRAAIVLSRNRELFTGLVLVRSFCRLRGSRLGLSQKSRRATSSLPSCLRCRVPVNGYPEAGRGVLEALVFARLLSAEPRGHRGRT